MKHYLILGLTPAVRKNSISRWYIPPKELLECQSRKRSYVDETHCEMEFAAERLRLTLLNGRGSRLIFKCPGDRAPQYA